MLSENLQNLAMTLADLGCGPVTIPSNFLTSLHASISQAAEDAAELERQAAPIPSRNVLAFRRPVKSQIKPRIVSNV